MNGDIERSRSGPPALVKKAIASLVLVAVVALAIDLVFHVLVTIFYVVAIVAVIAAVLWALKTVL
jgi:hypothetical protein